VDPGLRGRRLEPGPGGTLDVAWRRAVDAYPSNPVLYDLYLSDNAAAVFSGAPVYSGLQDNAATVNGLVNGTAYYFGVRAKDSWPVPNVTTNTDVSSGVAPSGSGGGPTTTAYFLRKDSGTTLWGTTQTNGNACGSTWAATLVTPTTNPPNNLGLLSSAKQCSNSVNNIVYANSNVGTSYRNMVGFYLPLAYTVSTLVTGSATGNSFGMRGSSAQDDVRIYLVAADAGGAHTLSNNFVDLPDIGTSIVERTPDMSGISITVPAGSRLGVLFQWQDTTTSGTNLNRITLDAYNTVILNRVTLSEIVPDTTAPTFSGGGSGITVADAATGGALNISWNTATDGGTPNTPPVRYDLYRSTVDAADVWNNLYRPGLGVTSIQDTGLTNGMPYYYGVRARDSYSPPNGTTNTDTASGVPTRGSSFGCASCHDSPPTDPGNAGSHAKHVSPNRIAQHDYTDCDKCHPGASAYPMGHQDGTGQLGFGGTAYAAA